MAKFILTYNGEILGEYNVGKAALSVGRKPDNDIQIDNLTVSGHHARVISSPTAAVVEDLKSTNGTYVNGRRITWHTLSHGDIIAIGKHELEYLSDPTATSPETDPEKTMIMSGQPGGSGARHQAGAAREEAHAETPKRAALLVLTGSKSGTQFELVKDNTTFGRRGQQVVSIIKRGGRHFIVHVEGESEGPGHPTVNGEPLGSNARQLEDGDVIEITDSKVAYFLSDAE